MRLLPSRQTRGAVDQVIHWRRGKKTRIFTTTKGAVTDLESDGTRRLLVNEVRALSGSKTRFRSKAT